MDEQSSAQQPETTCGEYGTVPFDRDEEQVIEDCLRRYLHKDEVSRRSGPGGHKLSYLEIGRAIELANWIFTYKGWSSSIQDITMDFCDEKNGRFAVGVSAIVRVTLQNGCYHEDVGYGTMSNCSDRGQALEKTKKEAISDALKRCLRLFGNGLGNCLNDKDFLTEIGKGLARSERLDLMNERPKKRMRSESQSSNSDTSSPWTQDVKNNTPIKPDPSLQSPPKPIQSPWGNNQSVKQPINQPNHQPNGPPSAENMNGTRLSVNGAINQAAQPIKQDHPLPTPMQSSNNNCQPPPPPSMMGGSINNGMNNLIRPALAPVRPGGSPTPPNNGPPLGYTPSNAYSQTVGNLAQNQNNPALNRFQPRANPPMPGQPSQAQLPNVPAWQQQQPVKQEPNGQYPNGNAAFPNRPPATSPPAPTYPPSVRSNVPSHNPFAPKPFTGPPMQQQQQHFSGAPVQQQFPGAPMQPQQYSGAPMQQQPQQPQLVSPFQQAAPNQPPSSFQQTTNSNGRTHLTPPSPVPANGTIMTNVRPGSQPNGISGPAAAGHLPLDEPFPDLPPTHPEPTSNTLDSPSRFGEDFNDIALAPDGR